MRGKSVAHFFSLATTLPTNWSRRTSGVSFHIIRTPRGETKFEALNFESPESRPWDCKKFQEQASFFFLNQCSRAEFVLLQTAWEKKKKQKKLNTHYRVLINMVFNKSPQYLKSNENCNMNATKNLPRVLKGYIYWFCGTLIFPLNTFIFYHLIVRHVFIIMCKMLWIESLSRTQRHEISVMSAPI